MDKKYTVNDFCNKYNNTNLDQAKESLVKSVMNPRYVDYERKIAICEKIIENSYYIKTEKNGIKIKKLHVNSPARYMLYGLYLVSEYTNIKVDFKKSLEEFNLLNKYGLLDEICNRVSEKEIKEFRMILDMVENDVLQNEYESHAFISNQVERFVDLTGAVLKPAVEQLNKTLENIDEKTIEKMIGKLKNTSVIKDKFNLMK